MYISVMFLSSAKLYNQAKRCIKIEYGKHTDFIRTIFVLFKGCKSEI